MDIVYFMLPMALGMAGIGLMCFVWALRSGQFDDLEGPRWRVLYEDDRRPQAPVDVPERAGAAARGNGSIHSAGDSPP